MSDTNEQRPHAVCSVVVTFHPDDNLVERLSRMLEQSACVIVVDNGSSADELEAVRTWTASTPRAELREMGQNLGLAAALNDGVRRAIEFGFRFAVTYDQDSIPEAGMVETLINTWERHPHRDSVAVVGPKIIDRNAPAEQYRWLRPSPKFPILFERVSCQTGHRDDVTFVITSGSLLLLRVFQHLGQFREDLFIDYIDHEYCLRARANGYRIVVTGDAGLLHALGDKREVKLGGVAMRPTFHSPSRLYYIYRNRIPLILQYSFREPHWLVFDVLATAHNLVRVALFEGDRRRKLRAAAFGTIDGLRGRLGAGAFGNRQTTA